MKVGVINLYKNLDNFGGAGFIAYDLHKNLFPEKSNYLMGFTNFEEIDEKYFGLTANEYLKFTIKNILRFKKYIFISHHRQITTYLKLFNSIFLLNLKIIHVAHNEFYTLKHLTLFPENIFCVSHRVKENLINYFKLKGSRIKVIHNGLADEFNIASEKVYDNSNIRILYPARINSVKQQLAIVKKLSGRLNENISIDFAGTGEDFTTLDSICKNSHQFNCLGFINISEYIYEYEYVMLFTKNEGLPLSLIEACMFQKPVIANDVGGNLEILQDGVNGFILSNFENLSKELNELKKIKESHYRELSANARKIYLKKFTKAQMFDDYRSQLSKLY